MVLPPGLPGSSPEAHADFNNGCPYPGIYRYVDLSLRIIVVDANAQNSSCWFPREVNNTFYRCIFKRGGGGVGANLGVPIEGGGNAGFQIGIAADTRVIDCSFVCPDGTEAETPNPTGVWGKDGVPEYIKKRKCPSLGHKPDPWPYEIRPPEELAPPGEGGSTDERAAVTNPTESNPNQQVNRMP